jgi:hypothetical protein
VSNQQGALETLWKHVLDHWEEEAAHRAFLEHCRQYNLLVEAAVRYRGMKGDHERGAVAEQKLTAIRALALSRLAAARTPEPRRSGGRMMAYVLIAFFVIGTVGLLAYLRPGP